MDRQAMLQRVRQRTRPWDVVVIGGGATGVGVAIDAAARGYEVALFEQADFGKGTSSRSTKIIHGGVRYLKQGDLPLVLEALRERGILRRNAPHLVHDLPFLVPAFRRWEKPYYALGLHVYDLLARDAHFARTQTLSRAQALERIPTLRADGLRGGVLYSDGQFEDARLLLQMALTATDRGAVLLNYSPVVRLTRDGDTVTGVVVRDEETGEELEVQARAVVNAAGPFSDGVRRLADPKARPLIVPSQGVHVVLPRRFLPGDCALMVPRTSDGRVLFAIPWLGHTLVGTTDTPLPEAPLEPVARAEEVEFLLQTAGKYLHERPTADDVQSVFAGIRPLVAPKGCGTGSTAAISREHFLEVDRGGVITIAGGKWTTYRKMAEDCVNLAAKRAGLPHRRCLTEHLPIHGYDAEAQRFGKLALYGSDAARLQALADADLALAKPLHPDVPILAAEVVWAARSEMARTVEDVLARRTRALFLNARAALEMAPRVAELLAAELKRDNRWAAEQVRRFTAVARGYLVESVV